MLRFVMKSIQPPSSILIYGRSIMTKVISGDGKGIRIRGSVTSVRNNHNRLNAPVASLYENFDQSL